MPIYQFIILSTIVFTGIIIVLVALIFFILSLIVAKK